MDLVIGWLVLSVVVGVVAAIRGRSFFGGFLVSLFFSPLIGLIVVLVSKTGEQLSRESARKGGSSEFRVCPQCAEVVRREALVCRFCNADLSRTPPPPTGAEKLGRAVRELFR